MPRFMHMDPAFLTTELMFSVIVIVLCFLIYHATKDMYFLTKHKGIEYFRKTFLFFGLAFAFRFLFHMFAISGFVFDFDILIPPFLFGPLSLLVTGYFSTMGILYLLFSLVWKKIFWKYAIIFAHILSVVVSLLLFINRSPHILVLVQLLIIIAVAVIAYVKKRKSNGFSKLFVMYMLLFFAWLSNILTLSPRFFIPFEIKILSYSVSIVVFSLLLYKVLRWTK